MSLLTARLTKASGLGGPPSAGPQSTSTFGMGTLMAAAQSTGQGVLGTASTASGDVRAGRVSMAVLEVILVLLIGFYVWTRGVQGGG